ncbi:hypothetical protein HOD61_01075 [archaeon]|jgi:hypothetical protein|nr:hypothetical protein [archaeon]
MNKIKKSLLTAGMLGLLGYGMLTNPPKLISSSEFDDNGVNLELRLDSTSFLDISDKEMGLSRERVESLFSNNGASCAGALSVCYAEVFRGRRFGGLIGAHYKGDNGGVYGNAWDMRDNVISQGGEVIYSGDYDNFKSIDFDIGSLSSGDILGIYYDGSNYKKPAKESLGDNYYTHVGLIIGENDLNEPIIIHYVNKQLIVEPLKDLIDKKDYSLKEVFRP